MWYGHLDLYMNNLQEIINTPNDEDNGYFIEVDLRRPKTIKEKTKNFPFCPENKIFHKDKNNEYMKTIKPKNQTKAEKLM